MVILGCFSSQRSFTSWLEFEEVAYRLKRRDEIVEKESHNFATYTHKLCLHGLSILHEKCKVRVILACTHNSMMISIHRNHQEGEEHAKRSCVSSLVRWLFEGIVLTLEPKKY